MSLQEAIILAGGKGTRLAGMLPGIPKPMAPVRGRPFIQYVLASLQMAGIRHVVISTGFLGEKIESFYGSEFSGMQISYAREPEALGTGGAIKYALSKCRHESVLVLNGDSYFTCDPGQLFDFAEKKNAGITLALKKLRNFDRFGSIDLEVNGKIRAFREKAFVEEGLINTGVYVIRKEILAEFPGEKFSFEKDILENPRFQTTCFGLIQKGYFIDIGIPEDYKKVQREILYPPAIPNEFREWSLFLDRDGVLNERIVGDYVRDSAQWKWLPGAVATLAQLRPFFKRIILVTNQQGIHKGLFTEGDLERIHAKMLEDLKEEGGSIDGIYFCPGLAENDPECRKPRPGMAYQARQDFPDIDFMRALMVGDSVSDMEFGKNLGMKRCYVGHMRDAGARLADGCIPALADLPDMLRALGRDNSTDAP